MIINNIDINIWVHNRFKNNIIPVLPCLITTYLISNPEKLNLYLDKKLNVNKLLTHIASVYKDNKQLKLIDLITNYVENQKNEFRIWNLKYKSKTGSIH